MLTWRNRFRILADFGTPEVIEFKAGVSALSWGLWLLLPGDMFALYPPFFLAMSKIAPEWAWGAGVAATGLAQIFLSATPNWAWRRFAALHACAMWAFLTTLYLLGEWRAPGVALALTLSVANAWVFYRLRRFHADGEETSHVQ
jgi:hypothetical protein